MGVKRDKKDIRLLSIQELRDFFIENDFRAFRGDQVYRWLWKKGVHDFKVMSNLSKSMRDLLEESFIINNIRNDRLLKSKDGTIKNAIKLFDNLIVESVLIPSANRSTACVSSQVGCSLDCKFCATAKIKRMRNLNADEIYDQVVLMDKQSRNYFGRPLSNIVFMGMGEPLMNYNNLMKSIDKITQSKGLNISPSRITVSTSGIPKMINKMADEGVKFRLAVSLHSARQTIREKLMPFAKKFPLHQLAKSIQNWYSKLSKPITYEYIVWKGINDREEDISALITFCRLVPCKVNLIEYNSIGDKKFLNADKNIITNYQLALKNSGIIVTIRNSRGEDINAACGQLANIMN